MYLTSEEIHFLDLGNKDAELRKLKQEVAELKVTLAKHAAEIVALRNEDDRSKYLKRRAEIEGKYGIIPGSRWGYLPETGEIDSLKQPEKETL